MQTEQLFNVIFEGNPVSNFPKEKAINAMADLTKKQPGQITGLFNGRPTVLKRSVPRETAEKYVKILQNKGLACHFVQTNPVANSEKVQAEKPQNVTSVKQNSAPDIKEKESFDKTDSKYSNQNNNGNGRSFTFEFPKYNGFINLLSLGFLLPQSIGLKSGAAKLPPASAGQRIWAAVVTFSHMIFTYYIMQILVGIIGGIYLSFTGEEVTRSFAEGLRGGSGILAVLTVIVILPLIWRGHSFGQRAMGILLIPSTDEDIDQLSGPAVLGRKLSFRTRSVNAASLPSSPWKSALIPFGAAIAIHFVVLIPFAAFLGLSGSGEMPSDSLRQTDTSNDLAKEVKTAAVDAYSQNTLRQIHAGMSMYIVESGGISKPLNRATFSEMAGQYLDSRTADLLISRLENGSMRLKGDLIQYQIGLYDDNKWIVLNEQGGILEQEVF